MSWSSNLAVAAAFVTSWKWWGWCWELPSLRTFSICWLSMRLSEMVAWSAVSCRAKFCSTKPFKVEKCCDCKASIYRIFSISFLIDMTSRIYCWTREKSLATSWSLSWLCFSFLQTESNSLRDKVKVSGWAVFLLEVFTKEGDAEW